MKGSGLTEGWGWVWLVSNKRVGGAHEKKEEGHNYGE